MAGGFKFKKKNPQNWQRFERTLRKSLAEPRMRKFIKQANMVAGLRMVKGVRDHISKWDDPKNATLTAAIKGDDSPLIDSSQMWAGINSQALAWNLVFIGVNRKDRNFSVAAIIHEGAQIKVSPRMAVMFHYLFWASKTGNTRYLKGRAKDLFDRYPGPWPPLREGRVINIPPRKFFDRAFSDAKLIRDITKIWRRGIEFALRSS